MQPGFCINGTVDPHSSQEFHDILVDMNPSGIALGCILLIGCCFSVIPQHVKIIKTKSVIGLSFLWMFLGNMNQFGGFVNMFVLKYPQIQACTVLGFSTCGPSLLSLFQSFGIWLLSFPIYILYLIYAPRDLNLIEKEKMVELAAAKKEYKYSKIFFTILVLFIVVVGTIVAVFLSDYVGVCSHTTYIFGYSMGILSTIVTFIQWSPQIYKTIRDKVVGSFSITMLLIQGPGSLVNLYFLIFVSKESVSTWLSYLCSSIQIFTLLALLIFYDRRNKRIKRELQDASNDEEQDLLYSSSPSVSVQNYKETHPLLPNNSGPKSFKTTNSYNNLILDNNNNLSPSLSPQNNSFYNSFYDQDDVDDDNENISSKSQNNIIL
ncbi:hypothetical protein DICPUDRAFT_57646 [Dictyostelium purpureum]|uniref:PQ-loop repeat-containing protein n=1 Tax=Dictyostelium purpureum TaxID=5786 RepID=F0ZWX6_DICPU|nr:uncharacterized protein DICPUDRAFT_57646 [Dictyostelium purpureum]EGC31547.1 hypothetical protein DICPUDRAFT_57646 [Dictyostelium purpureum]|eukprot:XP_003291918.1 hypothetical protein DICPUDRAFT_57646 [Dictyostelium purpureum]